MTDTEQLKASCDLRRPVEQDLGDALKLLKSNTSRLPRRHKKNGGSFSADRR